MTSAARLACAVSLALVLGTASGCVVAKTGAKVGSAAVRTTGKVAGAAARTAVDVATPDKPATPDP